MGPLRNETEMDFYMCTDAQVEETRAGGADVGRGKCRPEEVAESANDGRQKNIGAGDA